MQPNDFENAVFDRWGDECIVCTRRPEEWLETTSGIRRQGRLSFHHVNGDDTDDRVENIIPVCQSCHVHIHRVDKPPYRKWHRQLPIEHRNAWNEYYHEYYEGPQLTREKAERRFGDEGGIPESIKYLKDEREDFDPGIFEAYSEDDSAGETDTELTDNDGRESTNPTDMSESTSVVCGDATTTSTDDTTDNSVLSERLSVSDNELGPELQTCPSCGRMGLPERIADHDCRSRSID